MFTPKFNTRVFVESDLEGVKPSHVSPDYCLSSASADEFQQLLTAAGMTVTRFDADPTAFAAGSPFVYSAQVPWFTIQDPAATPDILRTITANFNAGLLAMWWHRVPDGNSALMYCRHEIQAGLADALQKADAAA